MEILGKYEMYFKNIIENPDYILKDNTRENTALILKTINEINGSVNLILRLAVEGEDKKNKNSIITCIPIGYTRLKTYIKEANNYGDTWDKKEWMELLRVLERE